jgi:glycerol-3-phosphate acyltransferase PlsY
MGDLAAVALLAYLIGSVPTGVLLGRLARVDPRQGGSGNIGATNVARTAGMKLGLLTLLFDVVKGALPVLLAPRLFAAAATDPVFEGKLRVTAAIGAVAGHVFSVWLRFQGGKGVATGLGAILALAPGSLVLPLVLFAAVFAVLRWVSLASIVAAVAAPMSAGMAGYPARTVLAMVAIALVIVYRHRDNIERIFAGTEPRFGRRTGNQGSA